MTAEIATISSGLLPLLSMIMLSARNRKVVRVKPSWSMKTQKATVVAINPIRPVRKSSMEKRLPKPSDACPRLSQRIARRKNIAQTSSRMPPTMKALTCAVQGEFQIDEK